MRGNFVSLTMLKRDAADELETPPTPAPTEPDYLELTGPPHTPNLKSHQQSASARDDVLIGKLTSRADQPDARRRLLTAPTRHH